MFSSWVVADSHLSLAGTCRTPSDLAPGDTCTVEACVVQPSAPSGIITQARVSASNADFLILNIELLVYGASYHGGYVFSIDNTTPTSESVGGTVVATADQASSGAGISWSLAQDNIQGITEASFMSSSEACNGGTDGHCDTNVITNFYSSTSSADYAAGLCKSYTGDGFGDWYLPSICELSYDAQNIGSGCGTSSSPTIQNIQSTLFDNTDSGVTNFNSTYWSSTEYAGIPANHAWAQEFTNNVSTDVTKGSQLSVRCVRSVSPKKIFITATQYVGNLGGISGADNKCQTDANNPHDGRIYKALIVDGTNRAACVTANCEVESAAEHINWILQPDTQYVLASDPSTVIAETNGIGLFTFPVANKFTSNEIDIYTGLDLDWTTASGSTCAAWASNSGSAVGEYGISDTTNTGMIGLQTTPCDNVLSLYCVEQ